MDAVEVAEITTGFLVLLGIANTDTMAIAQRMAAKISSLRLFEDPEGRMNLGLAAVGGEILCVSQFTLYANVRRGRRPSFDSAATPEVAEPLYQAFCDAIEAGGVPCQRGRFGAHMAVSLVNHGPVTVIIDSDDLDSPRRA